MAGVNKTIIMGNMGRDPELSHTQGGMAVCKFSIATSKRKKDGTDVTSWHRCTAFGKTAETIAQYVGKGQQLYIEGELSYGQYEKDGITRYTTDIFVNTFAFCGSQNCQNDTQNNLNNTNEPQQQKQRPQGQQYQNSDYDGQPMNQQQMDDDIPF